VLPWQADRLATCIAFCSIQGGSFSGRLIFCPSPPLCKHLRVDGACSSSTLKEAASWGKEDTVSEQMVFAEATMALPLLASYAYHKGSWKKRKKWRFAKIYKD
jgi:hypothetical protein